MKRTVTINVIESIIPKRCRKARDIDVSKEIEYTVKEASSNDVKVAVRDFNKKRDYYYFDGNFYIEDFDVFQNGSDDPGKAFDKEYIWKLNNKRTEDIDQILTNLNNLYLLVDGNKVLKKTSEPVIYSDDEGSYIQIRKDGLKGYNLLQKEDILERVTESINSLNISDNEKEDRIQKAKCKLLNFKVLMPEVIKNPPCYHFTYKGHEIKLVDDMWYDARLDVIPYIDVTDIIKMDDEIMNERKLHDVGNRTSVLSIDGKLYYDVQNKFLVRITDYKNFKKPIYMD